MTAGEAIAAADALRPNQYSTAQKLQWLRRLDGQIRAELLDEHEGETPAEEGNFTEQTELLAPFPYDAELYSAYLFTQIDLHNAEIAKYNQSIALLSAAWRQFADFVNRSSRPKGARGFRL